MPANASQLYQLKMRPCWPYGETVDYKLAWGDGVETPYSGGAASWVQASHVWASPGTKRLDLVALKDSHGRVFNNKTTTRFVDVTPGGGTSTKRGMTWSVLGQNGAYVHVGSDNVTNPYTGDTSANASCRSSACGRTTGPRRRGFRSTSTTGGRVGKCG